MFAQVLPKIMGAFLCLLMISQGIAGGRPSSGISPGALKDCGNIPLYFVQTDGHGNAADGFKVQTLAGSHLLVPGAIKTQVRVFSSSENLQTPQGGGETISDQYVYLEKTFVGANTKVVMTGENPLSAQFNYLKGSSPSQWKTGQIGYQSVRYHQMYPGIDMVCRGTQKQLEYDFHVQPGVDPSVIQFQIAGAQSLTVNAYGELEIHTAAGIIKEKTPQAWQIIQGHKKNVDVAFILSKNNQVSFIINNYDATKPLVIDPLVFSTFAGGNLEDSLNGVVADSNGYIYVSGNTLSADFPTQSPALDTVYSGGGHDVVIMKFRSNGRSLVYSTFLGGSGDDVCVGLKLDDADYVYIAGKTDSTDFPVTAGAYKKTNSGGLSDVFVTKLNWNGNGMAYSTYLGGSGEDVAYALDIDTHNCAYVAGMTRSTNFPIQVGSIFTAYCGGTSDGFITKLSYDGGSLEHSSYLGGSGEDYITALIVDKTANFYLAGVTRSSDFPTTAGVLDRSYNGGLDGFVTKAWRKGKVTSQMYSTYLGGNGDDVPHDIIVDDAWQVTIVGQTGSSNFPVSSGTLQTTYGGGSSDAFLTCLDRRGKQLVYSSYLGGSNEDVASSVIMDVLDNVVMAGWTNSADFPVTATGFDTTINGGFDGFVSKIDVANDSLVLSSFVGGSNNDYIKSVFVDSYLNAFAAGVTESPDFPAFAPSWDYTYNGGVSDGFLTQLDFMVVNLPAIKLLKNESLSPAFLLSDYDEQGMGIYQIYQNPNAVASLSGDTVSLRSNNTASNGMAIFRMIHGSEIWEGLSRIKVSTYRLNKLPVVGINPGGTVDINILDYCYDTTGKALAPSFGYSDSLIQDAEALVQATWVSNSVIRLTASTTFNFGCAAIDVVAALGTSSPYSVDKDVERLWVYPNTISVGPFEDYGIEMIADVYKSPSHSLQTVDGFDNVLTFSFDTDLQAVKLTPQFSRMLPYNNQNWYTARMTVRSDNPNNMIEAHLYNLNGIVPGSDHVDVGANILFGVPTCWTVIETPIFAQETGIGYPQLILKGSNTSGNLYVRDVQVLEAKPTLMSTRIPKESKFQARTFDSYEMLVWGWSTTEGDTGLSIDSGNLRLDFCEDTTGLKEIRKLTARSGDGIYTPPNHAGYQVGAKSLVQKMSGTFEGFDAMVLNGCYGVASSGSYDIFFKGGQLIATAEFGRITDGYHYTAGNAMNGFHQFQFMATNNQQSILAVTDLDFLRDNDNPYYGDIELF